MHYLLQSFRLVKVQRGDVKGIIIDPVIRRLLTFTYKYLLTQKFSVLLFLKIYSVNEWFKWKTRRYIKII